MIASLTGSFVLKTPSYIHIDVHGVGYEVQISLNTYSKIQDLKEGTLLTHLQIKEDGHTLFGFAELAEKELFVQLINVNGVGASTARMMLSSMQPAELRSAIASGNTGALEKIKGIGRKSAERLILELREKMVKAGVESTASGFVRNSLENDALNALMALGIQKNTAEAALKKTRANAPEDNVLESIIKKSLQFI
ncbi:MAG: Holliday junction branch migration protein RuvA [Chitinophagaceae bacterium]|jgi:Holliday junction DNA helicase RuvA|nr:Holliday junction branch migration protein RuvA [Chitinophagaceae bacterium]